MIGMIITTQDYINTATILTLYTIAGWILIGVCALTVKYLWHDPIKNQDVNIIADYKQTNKTKKVA
jgi:hypothetical protein